MLLLALAACADSAPADTAPLPACTCDDIALPAGPVADEAAFAALLYAARSATFPELEPVALGVGPVEDLAYLRAWTELDTVGVDDGFARTYTIQYDPQLFVDPMPAEALAALLVHELGHVEDYVGKNSSELAEFALWYGTQDPLTSDGLADYERATDEKALQRGCADGLGQAREWIYARATPEVLAEKQHNYWTPDEIAAWSPTCR